MLTVHSIPFVPDQLQLMMSLPNNPGMYTMNSDLFLAPNSATSLCDTSPLYSTLARLIDIDKLNSPESPQLIVTATNIATGMLEYFDNREGEGITFDHIVASGSLPPSFPMTKIGDNYYWDGGIYSNTPLRSAFKALEKLGDEDSEREIILVELFPQEGDIPQNMGDVYSRNTQLSFESKIRYDSDTYKKTNDYVDMIHDIDKELPAKSEIRKSPGFRKLMGYKKIHKLTIIRHTDPEPLTGGADFRKKSIDKRIELGYKDAKEHLPDW
jgi:NTE family protein